MDSTGFLAVLASVALALSAAMGIAWRVWKRTGNSGWVDVTWTFGVGTVSIIVIIMLQILDMGTIARSLIVAVLVVIWTLRLGSHIALRTRGIKDDPRYAKLVAEWGSDAATRMFWLLQKQAWVSIPLVLGIILAASNPFPALRLQDWFGGLILLIAILGEAVADGQLRNFRTRDRGSGVCRGGLWAWSRHPNYFFQSLGWLAYPIIAVDLSGNYLWGWLALAAPLCMYWLLAYISGIPPLEEHMLATRGAKYKDYMDRTNAFFPWPPTRGSPA